MDYMAALSNYFALGANNRRNIALVIGNVYERCCELFGNVWVSCEIW